MYDKDKRSFFERLTGTMNVEEETVRSKEELEENEETDNEDEDIEEEKEEQEELFEEEDTEDEKINDEMISPEEIDEPEYETLSSSNEEGELAVDVYEDTTHIYVQAMIAGVEPDNVDVSITREMVTLRGKRINPTNIQDENYYHKELYWGGFSRKILLPEEIDPERSEAIEKHGLLTLKLPKLNKKRSQKLEVKSID